MVYVNIYGCTVSLSFFYCVVTYTIGLLSSSDSNIVFSDGGIYKNITYGDIFIYLYIYSHMHILKWEIVRKEQVYRAVPS